ncbi:MAG: choice-of-anchor J domain-containing protein [Bacteroidales bacterium]|nr:choice-of-anchor J domain-containing protein [Bacteroidales bacterium]MCF8336872.1 choice-of-anchor J domain-containing protein [Bacteroidales bacterium]
MKRTQLQYTTWILVLLVGFLLYACEDYTENYSVPEPSLVAEFTYTPSEELSADEPITFTNQSIIPDRMQNPVFHWNFGDGTDTTINDYDDVVINEGGVKKIVDTLSHTYDTAISNEVELLITTGSNDSAKYSETLVIQPGGEVLLEEKFDDINTIPENWALFNGDGGTVASSNPDFENLSDSAWIVWNSGVFNSKVAIATSWYDEEVNADDWMILPEIQVTGNTILTWDALSLTTSGDYPDDYQVFVSTTSQDPEGCLENAPLLTIDDEAIGEDVGGEGIQHREVDLSEYAGETIYIGFRLMTPYPGGDRLGIDNIKVTAL